MNENNFTFSFLLNRAKMSPRVPVVARSAASRNDMQNMERINRWITS